MADSLEKLKEIAKTRPIYAKVGDRYVELVVANDEPEPTYESIKQKYALKTKSRDTDTQELARRDAQYLLNEWSKWLSSESGPIAYDHCEAYLLVVTGIGFDITDDEALLINTAMCRLKRSNALLFKVMHIKYVDNKDLHLVAKRLNLSYSRTKSLHQSALQYIQGYLDSIAA